jgi:hypothetical protein
LNISKNNFTSGVDNIFGCTLLKVLALNENAMTDELSERMNQLGMAESIQLQKNNFRIIQEPNETVGPEI